MLRRGAALAAVTLTNQAQLSADLLVVGWSLGAAPAGDYYLASQIATSALLFANASGHIALARLPTLADEPERLAAALRVEARPLLWLAVPSTLALGLLAPCSCRPCSAPSTRPPRRPSCGYCPGSCCST